MLRFSAALFVFAPFAGALVTAGCVATSKVSDDISTQSLVASNKSVVVMRLTGAGPKCQHVSVLLGVRQAEGYRGMRALTVASVRSVTSGNKTIQYDTAKAALAGLTRGIAMDHADPYRPAITGDHGPPQLR